MLRMEVIQAKPDQSLLPEPSQKSFGTIRKERRKCHEQIWLYQLTGKAETQLQLVVNDLRSEKRMPVYLITNHIEFYEHYGRKFIKMIKEENGNMARMYSL